MLAVLCIIRGSAVCTAEPPGVKPEEKCRTFHLLETLNAMAERRIHDTRVCMFELLDWAQ
jgi:hypothetical protein